MRHREASYFAAFARFLSRNVASGDAADNTWATYCVRVATWLAWCRSTELELASATVDDVEDYREALIGAGWQPANAPIKLTFAASTTQQSAPACALTTRPSASAPRRKHAAEDFGYLSEGELALVLRAGPQRRDACG